MTFRRLILHNLGWKVVALLMALLLWLTIKASMRAQGYTSRGRGFMQATMAQRLSLPVAVLAPAGDDSLFTVTPGWVDVSVSTPLRLAPQGVDQREMRAYVDLTQPRNGVDDRHRVWVRAPEGTEVLEVQPGEVEVRKALPAAPSPGEK